MKKQIRLLIIISSSIVAGIIASLAWLLQLSFLETVLLVLAVPTVVYFFLLAFKPLFNRKLKSANAKKRSLRALEQQRKINLSKGLRMFYINKNEIWAVNYARATEIYRTKIQPKQLLNQGKLYYYINENLNNI